MLIQFGVVKLVGGKESGRQIHTTNMCLCEDKLLPPP